MATAVATSADVSNRGSWGQERRTYGKYFYYQLNLFKIFLDVAHF